MRDFQSTRRRLLLGAGAAGLGLAAAGARAQGAYPAKPIRLVNPFAPGGSADVLSRMFAARLGTLLGSTIYVDTVAGAGGTIGSDKVAKGPADGYTLLLSNVASQAIAPRLYAKLPYDVLKDFRHIALFGSFPNVFLVGPTVKAATLKDFIAEAKAQGTPLPFGSAGNGSTPHLSAELLKLRTGIPAQHIPFKGAGPALVALMAGETAFQFENLSTAIPQVRAGKLRALGVTSARRIAALPDVPTMQEAGVPSFVLGSWYGISGPASMPDEAVAAIQRATAAALKDPAMQAQMGTAGIEVPAIEPAEYPGFIAAEINRWGELVKASGAKVD